MAPVSGDLVVTEKRVRLYAERTVERPRPEDQGVSRSQGIHAGFGVIVQKPGPIALSADIQPDFLVQGTGLAGAFRQIHVQNLPHVTVVHRFLRIIVESVDFFPDGRSDFTVCDRLCQKDPADSGAKRTVLRFSGIDAIRESPQIDHSGLTRIRA